MQTMHPKPVIVDYPEEVVKEIKRLLPTHQRLHEMLDAGNHWICEALQDVLFENKRQGYLLGFHWHDRIEELQKQCKEIAIRAIT